MSNSILNLHLLSPVHIGDGDKLTKLDFIVDGNLIKVYGFERLISYLGDSEIANLISKLENIKQNIQDIQKEFIIPNLDKILIYSVSLNHKNQTPQEISKHIKTFKDLSLSPYIPGSSIKGAIRTAIIYKYLKDNFNNEKIASKMIKNKRFYLSHIKYVIDENFFQNFYVSDTQPVDISCLGVFKIEVFNTSKNKFEFAECLKEGTKLTFNIKLEDFKSKNPIGDYIKNWKDCCYEFSKDLITIEKNYWKDNNQNIYNFLQSIENENSKDNPIIRVGKFIGKLSHTIIPLLEINDLYQQNKYLFPKTRRKTSENQVLGWIRIED